MIEMTAKANQYDVDRLKRVLTFIADHTKKSLPSLVKQAAIIGIQSASKATKPGDKASVKTLALKYKLRPLMPIWPFLAGDHLYKLQTGKLWKTERKLSSASMEKAGMTEIKRAYKIWDKKKNRWSYIPYAGISTTMYDKEDKKGRIPGYGAAKAGWLKGLGYFGKPENTDDNLRRPVTKVTANLSGNDPFAVIDNLVEYVSITSPESARIGVNAAGQIIEHTYFPKLDQEIRAQWQS